MGKFWGKSMEEKVRRWMRKRTNKELYELFNDSNIYEIVQSNKLQ